MNLGPYRTKENSLIYKGNRMFKPMQEVRGVKPSLFAKRHLEIKTDWQKWGALIKIWNCVFRGTNEFMQKKGALLFDLPITTRMISSPGALTGTISSDVDPFAIKFFDKKVFLTQSSQLYLEFAITNPEINSVYCWEKSFRRERADFRHLPEFTHVEFESNFNFEDNLKFQQQYLQFLVKYILKKCRKEITLFLKKKEIEDLESFSELKKFERIKFEDAFKLLKEKTNNPKYSKLTIKNFCAYEEVLLTEILNRPLFVTHYIEDEVAFYHARDSKNNRLVINADFLYPGYGELIGSGERVLTRKQTERKARHFKLPKEDYYSYIESRDVKNPIVHSGWGMGVERFIQSILKLPFIWETKAFPRVDNQNRP